MQVMSYRRGRFINKFAHELHKFYISKLHVAKKLKMKWSLRASGSLSKRVCVSPSSTNARTLPRFIFSWECGASTSTFRIIGNQFRAKMAAIVEKVVRDAPDTRDKMSLQRHDLELSSFFQCPDIVRSSLEANLDIQGACICVIRVERFRQVRVVSTSGFYRCHLFVKLNEVLFREKQGFVAWILELANLYWYMQKRILCKMNKHVLSKYGNIWIVKFLIDRYLIERNKYVWVFKIFFSKEKCYF